MQDQLVDELDLKLIHALQIRPRIPWSTLAGVLQVDGVTLMRRWRRLTEQGLVRVTAMPAPPAGLELAFVEIDCQSAQLLDVAYSLAADPAVVSIDLTASGRSLLVTLIGSSVEAIHRWTIDRGCNDPRITSIRTQHVSALVKEASAWRPKGLTADEEAAVQAVEQPGAGAMSLRADERSALIEALSQHLRAPLPELSARTGISARRIGNALTAMTESGELLVRIDMARHLSVWPIHIWYFLRVPAARMDSVATRLARMSQTRSVAKVVGSYNMIATFWFRQIADVQRLDEALESEAQPVTVLDRAVVTRTVKHLGHLLDQDGLATQGRIPVRPA